LWAQHKAEDLATPDAFLRDPKLVWDWYAMRRARADTVEPNPGHLALAEMARRIPHFTLITQNVDGLHAKAGSPQVIELHGNIRRVKCFDCGKLAEDWREDGRTVPKCASCGGLLRPDVVWFGEPLDEARIDLAVRAAGACDVFLVVGTSALVYPAAGLPLVAGRAGALVVEVNLDDTPLTPHAGIALRGKAADVLPALESRL